MRGGGGGRRSGFNTGRGGRARADVRGDVKTKYLNRRRSLTPPMNNRPRGPRRSVSIDRRDYSKQAHDGFQLQHSYMLPDHPTKDSAFEEQGMLFKSSMFLNDAPAPSFFGLPQESSNLGFGSGFGDVSRFRDLYDEKEREKATPFSSMMMTTAHSQSRPFAGASSSGIGKDGTGSDFIGFYRDDISKFKDDTLEFSGFGVQTQFSDPRRERSDYLASDDVYKTTLAPRSSEFRDGMGSSSFMDLARERADTSRKNNNLSESSFWDQPRSLHADAAVEFRGLKGVRDEQRALLGDMDFRDMKGAREEYGSGYAGFGIKPSRDLETSLFDESYGYGDVGYRGRAASPLLSDRRMDVDMYRQRVSPPRRGKAQMDDDMRMFDLSPEAERNVRRKYAVGDNMKEFDSRSDRKVYKRVQSPRHAVERKVYRRMQSPSRDDEVWSGEERRRVLPSKKTLFGRSQNKMPLREVRRNNGGWEQSRDSSAHRERGSGISVKKRLRPAISEFHGSRPAPSEFHGSFPVGRRQGTVRPKNTWKRGVDDRHDNLNARDKEIPGNGGHVVKSDPPEGSEEFKQQVHKAFLRFSKLLNESPHQQKRYRDVQGKSSHLVCCVCGSLSKEFVDTHSLLTHSYHTLKVGLRTEHLGFHKALCVLMGWNWHIPPDTSKTYLSGTDAELKDVKEDLILWAPVVIIHNSSLGSKNKADEQKVVSIEGMEEILREMGFGAGKTRVGHGKPATRGVLLVKFKPTFSGLQEAEKLHKYFSDNNHGRKEFLQVSSSNGSSENTSTGEASAVKDLLYGYMALAEDLDKLDGETKKRCVVKSKKDIEAIADAPLNTD